LDHKLFVHAGIDPKIPLDRQDLRTLLWDRSFVQKAWELFIRNENTRLTTYEEVYLGHTPVPFERPIQSCEIWMMDTGAGWSGVLSLMDVNTNEAFTSDKVPTLYPGVEGRTKKK
jgi:serine/threonine protein phosphatase 1